MNVKNDQNLVDGQELNELYEEQIKQALSHFQDAAWLGTHSPFSTPYFLGSALEELEQAGGETAVFRGKILQTRLLEAATAPLNGQANLERDHFLELVNDERNAQGAKGAAYQLLLLDLKYFRHIFPPHVHPQAKQEADIWEFLGVSRSTLFTHLKLARQQLGENLLKQLLPAMRLEQPPQPLGTYVGLQPYLSQALPQLQQGKTLFINGAGGCGKTTLGATIAQHWPGGNVFWFTFWPSLNDQLDTLLFSLGHFLNQQGASHLWGQLVLHSGHISNSNLALSYLRTDLAQLDNPPLLCFDEVDYLLRDPEKRSQAAEELLTFLERMHALAPMLLIGQQPGLVADEYLTLSPLTLAETDQLLSGQHIALTPSEQEQLFQITGGNPRLYTLCIPLLKEGHTTLDQLPQAASIVGLFESLWRTMPPQEQALAQQLAVFRSPAPADAWEMYANGLARLQNHALLQKDSQGGVRLLPIFTDLIRRDAQKMSADALERCHMTAAAVRSERGEYTAAFYHLLQAGEIESAIHLWTVHRQQEMGRGQGSVAYALLQSIPQRRLSAEAKQALALSLAELCDLLGKPQAGLEVLEKSKWPQTAVRTIDALTLKGKFLNALGKHEEAVKTFDDNLTSLSQLLLKQVHLFTWRGFITLQQRELKQAFVSARQAQYEAELFYGLVQEEQGNYDEAYMAYQRALALASNLAHAEGIAKANRGLANLFLRQGKEEEALRYAETAVSHFEQVGYPLNVEKTRNTIIAIYFNQRRFKEVIDLGKSSLTFFQNAAMPYWASITAATLAEAYLEVGDYAQAKATAHQVLTFEEPHSVPYAMFTLGHVAKQEQVYTDALTYFTQARDLSAQANDRYMQAFAERALGELHALQGNKELATESLERAITYFSKLNNEAEIENSRAILAQL